MSEKKLTHSMRKKLRQAQKDFWSLVDKPPLVFLLVMIFCAFLSVFYFLSIQRGYQYEKTVNEVDEEKFTKVLNRWEEDEEKNENIGSSEYHSIFFESEVEESEEEVGEEDDLIEEHENNNIDEEEPVSPERIEDILAQTLFEFYQERDMGMPQISERAQIWEDVGLGSAEEYTGTYQQNILFLETLKNEMENN